MNTETFSHRQPRSPSSRRGFTLVELLVTILIVVILAALGFTVSRNVLEKAAQTKAVSSLRQVSGANMAYSAENQGSINTLRFPGDPRERRRGQWVADSYWGRLTPYLFAGVTASDGQHQQLKRQIKQELDQIFNTPDASKMNKTVLKGSKIYHDRSGLPVPIGFNRNVHSRAGTQPPEDAKTSHFRDPGNVIYAAYGFGLFDHDDGKQFVERPTDGSKPDNNIYYLKDGKALVSFLDGRVESLSPPIAERRFE